MKKNYHSDLRQILTNFNTNYRNYVTFLLDLDKEELYMAEFKQNSIRVWNSFRLVIIFHIYLAYGTEKFHNFCFAVIRGVYKLRHNYQELRHAVF